MKTYDCYFGGQEQFPPLTNFYSKYRDRKKIRERERERKFESWQPLAIFIKDYGTEVTKLIAELQSALTLQGFSTFPENATLPGTLWILVASRSRASEAKEIKKNCSSFSNQNNPIIFPHLKIVSNLWKGLGKGNLVKTSFLRSFQDTHCLS